MYRKTLWTALVVVMLTAIPLWAAEEKKVEEKKAMDDKIAVVNGTAISREDFNRMVEPIQKRLEMQGTDQDKAKLPEIRKNILENLINRELLFQESQKSGIKVDDAALDKQMTDVKKQFPSEKELDMMMKRMNLTEESFKIRLRQDMTIQEFIDKQFVSKIKISDEETKAYYDGNADKFKQPEEVKASHILIKTPEKADDTQKAEARKKIEAVQKRLKKGEDFAAVAKEVSDCPSKEQGGDLGYFAKGQMVKPFEEAAFAMKPGETSNIVETDFGFHLIKVADKKAAGTRPYDSVKDSISGKMKQEKLQKDVTAYLDKVKESAKIERYL